MVYYLKKQILIATCIYAGQVLAGYGMGWSAPLIPKLQDPDQTPLPDVISDGEASLSATLIFVGTVIGPFLAGYVSNTKGRKASLFLAGGTILLAFILLALAVHIIMIFIGRVLMGAGVGIIFIINAVYLGEMASTNIRGTLLTITGVAHTFGVFLVYSVGPFLPYVWTNWLGVALSLLYLGGLCTVPESPVFQILLDKETEAKETLVLLGRPEDLDKILVSKKTITESNWLEIFTVKVNRMALFIAATLDILQQMSGIGAVLFFATSIFEFAGSSIEPNIATIIIGATKFSSSIIAPFFVDRTGRRSLLLISTAGCFFSLFVLGTYFQLDEMDHPVVDSIKWLPLVSLIAFFISFGSGLAIIPITLMGEMFTYNVRSSGSVLVMTLGWVVGFIVSSAFGYIVSALGGAITFWLFSAACALSFLFTLFFVPETKGKTLVEVLDMMSK